MDYPNRLPLQRPTNASPQQFASTPTNQRFFIPRFGHSSIPSYPRPGSSASKPNPGCSSLFNDPYSGEPQKYPEDDSMRNNFGSTINEDSFINGDSSFQSLNSSAYFTCLESFIDSPAISSEAGMRNNSPHFNDSTPQRFQPQNMNRTPQRFQNTNRTPQRFETQIENAQRFPPHDTYERFLPQREDTYWRFEPQNENTYEQFQPQNENNYQRFQPQNAKNSQQFQHQNANGHQKKFLIKNKNFVKKKPFSDQKNPTKPLQYGYKKNFDCPTCSIKFTSVIPYEMHMRGSRHARKLKFLDSDKKVNEIVKEGNGISATGTSFRCELCDVQANSSLQFMTHLEGQKHKLKISEAAGTGTTEVAIELDIKKEIDTKKEKDIKKEIVIKKEEVTSKENITSKEKDISKEKSEPTSEPTGKANAALRRIEINSVLSRPTKFTRLACDICCIVVNSNTQLQQHLASKKHQAKVNGKPLNIPPKKKPDMPEEKKAEVDTAAENTAETQP